MSNQEEFGTAAVPRGADRIAAALRATLGPLDRKVILNPKKGGILVTTNAGTIVRKAEFKNPFERIGARMMRDVVNRMAVASDGSATAAILAHAMFREGLHALSRGAQPVPMIHGINSAVQLILAELRKLVRPVPDDMIQQVGAITAYNDWAVGDIIAEAMKKVGRDGTITVEESKAMTTELQIVAGMKFDCGYLSPYFVTDADGMECVLEDPYILIHEKKVSNMRDMLPLLEQIARSGRPLLIIAEEVDGEALATLVVNKLRGTLNTAAVKAPGFGDQGIAILEDIAVLTGGKVILDAGPIKLVAVKLKDLGKARRITIDKDSTTIVDGAGSPNAIEVRINHIHSQIEKTASDLTGRFKSLFRGQPEPDSLLLRSQLQERLGKLAKGVAVIKVAGPTESEMKEKKACVADAVQTTQAAVREGVVPGGGVALLRASRGLLDIDGDRQVGAAIVARACEAPFRAIAAATGLEEEVAVAHVAGNSDAYYGLNALTGHWQDLFAAGIVDPARIVCLALEVAAAESASFLNSETAAFEP
jgi:chaperonin GroEL